MNGMSSRATNGKVTNTVAITIPGTAKTIRRPCAWVQGPRIPWAPKSSTVHMPAMTGETPNGRSMSESSTFLPG